MNRIDDVIIIGAGVIGLFCAFYLSKEKLKVRVLEKDFPGSGDTTKTGGGIRYLHGSPMNIALSKMSHSFWTMYKDKSNKNFFQNIGHLFLTSKPEKLESFRQQVKLHKITSFDVQTLTNATIKEKWTDLRNISFKYGNYCETGGYLNHFELVKYLLKLNKSQGVKVENGAEVTDFLMDNNSIEGVKTKKNEFKGKLIVNATGARANLINKLVAIKIPFVSRRHELLIATSKYRNKAHLPWLIDLDNQVHLRTNGKGLVLIGGFLGEDRSVDPLNFSKSPNKAWIENVLRQAQTSFGLTQKTVTVIDSWAGLYPGTRDYLPVIERSKSGLFIAAGLSGTGLMHGPAVGKIITSLILGKSIKGIDLKELSSDRFYKEGKKKEYLGF